MVIWKSVRPHLSRLIRFLHISYIETKSAYHGSYLGVLWVPLSSLIFSAMLALVFRHSDTMSLTDFFLYVFVGYIFWGFISDSINGSTDVIQTQLEFAIHNNISLAGLFWKRLVDRLFEYFLNAALLIIIILLSSPSKFGFEIALFVPFLGVSVLASIGVAYLVNIITVFFPDTKSVFRVGTRFMFFVSPVFWSAADTTSGIRAFLVQYNPVAYFLSLSRQVFGIEPVAAKTWLVAAAISAIMSVAAYVAYRYSQEFVRNLK